MINKNLIKIEYPYIEKLGVIYLDSACTSLKMKTAIESQREFLYLYPSCIGNRSFHRLSTKADELINRSRDEISKIINSKFDEVIFTSGTTDSFNILASSFDFTEGDEIILSPFEHNSVFLSFYNLAIKKRLKIKIIPQKDFKVDFVSFKKMITHKTRVLCISKASNFLGGSIETDEFVNEAKKRNIKIFMDLAQYAPTHKIDVKELGCDACSFSAHKIGGVYGIGVLYVNSELYSFLKPSKVGGGTIKEIKKIGEDINVKYLDKYNFFEAGIGNYSGIYSLYKTMKKLDEISYEGIRKHISLLVKYAIDELKKIDYLKIVGSNLEDGSIVSFYIDKKNFSYHDFLIYLSSLKKPIAVRAGRLCADLAAINTGVDYVIRISFFIYNSEKDIDEFVKTLKEYIKKL